jgi:hypothetical protein
MSSTTPYIFYEEEIVTASSDVIMASFLKPQYKINHERDLEKFPTVIRPQKLRLIAEFMQPIFTKNGVSGLRYEIRKRKKKYFLLATLHQTTRLIKVTTQKIPNPLVI